MKVVAGLGNPGRTYDRTRHNAGFHVLDELARRWGGRFRSSLRFRVQSCRVTVEGAGEILLVKPQSFMNRSGEALEPVMRKHGVAPGQTLIVYDDADLPEGIIRMRARGSAGGHNGMKSVMARLGTDAVPRLRVGVGRAVESVELKEYVLKPMSAEDAETMKQAVHRAADAVCAWARHGAERAMNEYNG